MATIQRLLISLLVFPGLSFGAISDIADATDHAFSGTSATPTEPTGTAENDVVFAFCSIASTDGAWTDPADFTQIDVQTTASASPAAHTYIGYKVRASTAGSGYAFSYSGTAASIACTLQTFRGEDTASVLDVTYSSGSHYAEYTNDAALTAAPAITTNTNNAWVCLFQWNWDGNITTGMPTGYTEYAFFEASNRTRVIACKDVTSAGTETPGAWGHTDVGATTDSVNYTIAIKPATSSSLLLRRRR